MLAGSGFGWSKAAPRLLDPEEPVHVNSHPCAISLARRALPLLLALLTLLPGCGGGGGSATSPSNTSPSTATGTSGSISTGNGNTAGSAHAAAINAALGKPARLLVGLGAGNSIADIQTQGIQPDVIDTYLVGVGSSSWISWNSPSGAYLTLTAQHVAATGAIPLFTLYGMAQNGDGNISGISDTTFMTGYWAQAKLMFTLLGSYGAPALVNLEPDFWGYVYLQAPNHDPTQLPAAVTLAPECASLPNTAAGIGPCLLRLARQYAPRTLVGFPPSFWGVGAATLVPYMQAIGADQADFIVAQTSDRDAGCAEVASPPPECQGRTGPFYWDENNVATPNFSQSEALLAAYSTGLGGDLPLLWWQTPMGVPSSTPGGTTNHYRDDHVDYMLRHPGEYAAINTFAMVFSSGASSQTTIATDGGQFATLSKAYLATGGSPLQ